MTQILQERNIINSAAIMILPPIYEFIYDLRFFLLAAFVLILADLRFGIRRAKARDEEIRYSRMWRRTGNKFVDYFVWTMVAGVMGIAFGEPLGIPLVPLIVLAFIFKIELESCYRNYYESKGYKLKDGFSVFTLFRGKDKIFELDQDLLTKINKKKDGKRNKTNSANTGK